MRLASSLDHYIKKITGQFAKVSDQREGRNTSFSVCTALSLALALFFTKSQSFHNFYNSILNKDKAKLNITSVFNIKSKTIPCANTIRNILDKLDITNFSKIFYYMFSFIKMIKDKNGSYIFKYFKNKYLIALDGTQYFSSKKIHCDNCCTKKHNKSGNNYIEYVENLLSAVVIALKNNTVFILDLEFIRNSGNYIKQDCEINAAKRLIVRIFSKINPEEIVLLGDDIYSHQPLIELILAYKGASYIFTCKENSHKTVYEHLIGIKLPSLTRVRNIKGNTRIEEIYSWIKNIPLNNNKNSIYTNYISYKCTTINNDTNEIISCDKFAYATNITPTKQNVEDICTAGRARWQIENGQFNTLKNHDYNLEHNYGHGKKALAAIMVCLCSIAFNLHVLGSLIDENWQNIKESFATYKAFFDELRMTLIKNTVRSITSALFRIRRELKLFPPKIIVPPG
jgi:hypothetical protein